MGITIGKILVVYDVNAKAVQVKEVLKQKGYSEKWITLGSSTINSLPNRTLWHSHKSSNQAMQDLKEVCNSLNVKLEKAITILASEFVAL